MKNKIGIIGDGQLGTRLFKSFQRDNVNVRCYSRKNGFDLKDPSVLNEILYENTAVINCAAMTNVDGCETNKAEAIHLNSVIPAVLGSINSYNDCKIVHISTDYVYGDAQMEIGQPKDNVEDGPCIPLNFYGESKLAGDIALMNNIELRDRLLILRPSWLFDYESENSIVARLFNKLNRKDSTPAKVVDDIFGIPTSCEAVYEVIKKFVCHDNLVKPGCYNIRHSRVNPGETVTMFDVAAYIESHFTEHSRLERVKHGSFKTTAIRQTNSYLNINKLHSFGIYFKTWHEAIDDFINFKMNEDHKSD